MKFHSMICCFIEACANINYYGKRQLGCLEATDMTKQLSHSCALLFPHTEQFPLCCNCM